ncbi:hypothetical protein F4860DRAFT_527360 [Xylaria cubensis]|nr:hypothetical protein F4860DRAFT_527360 [Xylaria cubensis]
MPTIPRLEDFQSVIADILSTPSLSSYSRALTLIEEVVDLVIASPKALSDIDVLLLRSCALYRTRCEEAITHLTKEASVREHMVYERRASSSNKLLKENKAEQKNRRKGVVYKVDRGEHIAAALEALRLEEFLQEQERQNGGKKLPDSETAPFVTRTILFANFSSIAGFIALLLSGLPLATQPSVIPGGCF